MSKIIPFVADVHMEGANGELLYRVPKTDGATTVQNDTPWMLRQLSFMLERIGDPAFVDKLDPIEGEILRAETRGKLKRQSKDAEARGGYELEDEPARRLWNAVVTPVEKVVPQLAPLEFNKVPFILAVKNMTTPPAEGETAAPQQ